MNNKLTDLEALESIVVDLTPIAKEQNKEEIEQIKKSLEVLEIIKNKEVNVQELFDFIKKYGEHNGIYMYNGHRPYEKRINEEELDALKEVLKYGKL